MIYVDTNVFVYAIENHPRYGTSCKKILEDLQDGRLEAACSVLVLVELINVLKKVNDTLSRERKPTLNLAANIEAVMSLPVKWLDLDFLVIERASSYSYDVGGVDYVHVSSMELDSITEIISADRELDRVKILTRVDPVDYRTPRR
jgi:predicted nucleic acid-binding protein